MSWIATGVVAGTTAATGYMNAKAKQKQEKQNMLANAEAIRYSPWTKMNPEMMGKEAGSPLLGAASGALGGAMQGHNIASAASADKAAEAKGAADIAKTGAETNYLNSMAGTPGIAPSVNQQYNAATVNPVFGSPEYEAMMKQKRGY